MILWKKWGVRIAEYFFDEQPADVRADLVHHRQWSSPVPGSVCTPFHTRSIDLHQTSDEIFRAMETDNRKSIRRSERSDSLTYCYSDRTDPALFLEVADLHDKFAALKGLPRTDRARLWGFWEAHSLDISLIRDALGNPLVWRISYCDSRRVRNLHNGSLHRALSDSAQKNLVGRAHRYGVWRDILRFKEAGLETYDFGGWYMGTTDVDKLKINLFKKEFGGTIEQSFNCVRGATLRGRQVLLALSLRNRLPWRNASSR
jgi:hypothetical protein